MADTALSPTVFKAGADVYAVGHMDPRMQLLVLKRLMRFVPALTGSDKILGRVRAGEVVQAEDALDMMAALAPLLADTPDADIDFIADACLSVTRHRGQGDDARWYAVRDTESGTVMNRANAAVVRKLVIVANVLRVIFGPMLNDIAPAVAGLTGGPEEAAN